MMCLGTADMIAMRPISKFDSIEKSLIDQNLNTTIEGCSSQVGVLLSQCLPEIIDREVGIMSSQFSEMIRDQSPRTCTPLPHSFECCTNVLCNHSYLLSVSRLSTLLGA